jgi:HD-GYP domain-containing protein (c-di-GMP phosphodiesterase class II)
LLASLDNSEDYLYQHSLNVCLLSILISAAYGYSANQVILIGISALLHDIGMLLIDRDIRFKREDLDNDEIFKVRSHPALGEMILLKSKSFPPIVCHVVFQSHERENGSGYPLNIYRRLKVNKKILSPAALNLQAFFTCLSSLQFAINAA